MKGGKSQEVEVNVAASEMWAIYGTLRFAELLPELLPHVFIATRVLTGDGGVGTIVQLTASQGGTGKERFVRVDHENYIKEAVAIEGDILKLGFLSYMIRVEIIGKGQDASVVRSTVEYEFDDGRPELEALISTEALAEAAQVYAKYVQEQKTSS